MSEQERDMRDDLQKRFELIYKQLPPENQNLYQRINDMESTVMAMVKLIYELKQRS